MVTTNERAPIKVGADSEPARILAEAAETRRLVESDGVRYRVSRVETPDEDIWAGYDPERVREALEQYAGSWSDVDAEQLKDYIYRAREEGSRPPDRPRPFDCP